MTIRIGFTSSHLSVFLTVQQIFLHPRFNLLECAVKDFNSLARDIRIDCKEGRMFDRISDGYELFDFSSSHNSHIFKYQIKSCPLDQSSFSKQISLLYPSFARSFSKRVHEIQGSIIQIGLSS